MSNETAVATPENSAPRRAWNALMESWDREGRDLTTGALILMGLAFPMTAAVVVPMALWTLPMVGMAFAFLINWYIMFAIVALAVVAFAWPVGAVLFKIGDWFSRTTERMREGFANPSGPWPNRQPLPTSP